MGKITRRCPKCGQWISGEVIENVGHQTARHFTKKGGAWLGGLIFGAVGTFLLGPIGTAIGGGFGAYVGGQLASEGVSELEGKIDMDYRFSCLNPNCNHTWIERLRGSNTVTHPVSRKKADRKEFSKAIVFFIITGLSFWYCFTHNLSHTRHVDGHFFSFYKDYEVTDYNYWWIFLGLIGIVFLIKGIKIISNIKLSSLSNNDFVIYRVDVGVVDYNADTIVDYGQPIYHSQTRYLQPRLCVKVANEGVYDIYYNLYCNGQLRIGNESNEYTTGHPCDLYSYTTTCIMQGWGADKSGFWPVGRYRFEFFCNGKNIGNKEFDVLEG